ncbi:MAG: gamma-glutamyl-gamma-aminobutyrate hydrolase family protein [Chloroflexi bacterium]|nr:gamma-glutamyl-gamma-aminobutyrate hydrolase family protein [Chloroflexota bacterium]MBU1746086.1 gamma-glutamyl-gamma-aminobutyrate hydrolase family protein [Chloroflexota bacterium]
MRPLIGVTCLWDEPTLDTHAPRFGHNQVYARAVVGAGGLPVLLPLLPEPDLLRELFDRLDGILLSGGRDVDPAHFHEQLHPKTVLVPPASDEVELTLARWALAENKPALGICRGHQVLNVAAGGTLYQDIPSQCPSPLGIDHTWHPERPRDQIAHTVTAVPGTRLAAIIGTDPLPVNSSHHQAVRHLAPAFVAGAWTPDGVLEGLERPGETFCVGVQFHPEELWQRDPRALALFRALVEAAQP